MEESEYLLLWLGNMKEDIGEDSRIILKTVLVK